MIRKVAHLADVHIKNDISTHKEYNEQFEKLYDSLIKENPDRIVVVGDITHDFLSCSYEAEIMAINFIVKLTEIAPTIVVEGNHCIRKTDLKRTSALKNFVSAIKRANPKSRLTHYNQSGFYEDENIVWVNHSHLQKTINPWTDIEHIRDNNKTYIDLFHDPINGCSNDIGYKFESKRLRKISDFKGDFGMFGDIHKFQYLDKKERFAYPSSTIQQNFAESPDNHGFMIWNLDEKTGYLIELQTEYTKLNFEIEPGFDYDNITFNHKLLTKKSFIKIKWHDISANINDSNEEKIENYFKNLGIVNEIKYDKKRIYTDISESEILTESIDINNKSIQQQIFKDYLIMNGYDDDMIDEIIKIDEIVDERLEIQISNFQTNWKIDKFWLNNFKSYEKIDIDWKDINGIIQLYSKENQQGKSTILDGICYITHGTTLYTNKLGGAKTEKHGDARYINNKRDLDYCDGGMVISVDKKKYAIVRRTERTWNKNKTKTTSAKTTVFYYKDAIIDDEHLLSGESKTETQEMLNKLIVEFEDFIRLTLINSFNINDLISMDRATFIDSIIKDAGYDIFEKKLNIFKEYKKEISTEKIILDISETEEEIDILKETLNNYKEEYTLAKKEIDNYKNEYKKITNKRDDEIKNIIKIDDELLNLDIDDIENKISINNEDIKTANKTISNNLKTMKSLKDSYDENKYESLLKDLKTEEDELTTLKMKIDQLENKNETLTVKLESTENKIENIVLNKINSNKILIDNINQEIEKLNNDFEKKIIEKKTEIQSEINNLNHNIKYIEQKLASIKEKGISIKKEIKDLEKAKICPTCLRPFDDNDKDHLDAIEEKKVQLEQKIKDLMPDVKKNQNIIKENKKEIDDLNEIISNIETGLYTDDLNILKDKTISNIDIKVIEIEIIEKNNKDLKNDIYDNYLLDEIEKLSNFKNRILNEIDKNNKSILIGKNDIKDKKSEIEKNEKMIQKLKIEKDETTTYNSLKLTNERLELSIEKINNAIDHLNLLLEKYNSAKKSIKQNKIINEKINEYDSKLLEIDTNIDKLNNNINRIMSESSITKNKAKDLKNTLSAFKEQQRKDELLKIYNKCVSRDGIPFFLLMKSRDLINQELSDILSSVNFNIFFDEKMNLKMFMENHKDSIINVIQGSGAEKAFSAIALKLALRSINNNSRPNFLMLDEVTGNLKNKSVENFNLMLEKMKERIDKIIIIEQNHPIDYDYIFLIDKDKNNISHLSYEKNTK